MCFVQDEGHEGVTPWLRPSAHGSGKPDAFKASNETSWIPATPPSALPGPGDAIGTHTGKLPDLSSRPDRNRYTRYNFHHADCCGTLGSRVPKTASISQSQLSKITQEASPSPRTRSHTAHYELRVHRGPSHFPHQHLKIWPGLEDYAGSVG